MTSYKILVFTSRKIQVLDFLSNNFDNIDYELIIDKDFFKLKDKKYIIKFLSAFDIAFVYNYGAIIPDWAINIVPMVNIHYSLLPKYRGAFPVQAFLLNGDKKTGISWHILTKELDGGNILLQKELFSDVSTLGFSAKQVFNSLEAINFNILRLILINNKKGLEKLKLKLFFNSDVCHRIYRGSSMSLLDLLTNLIKYNCGKKQDNTQASYISISLLNRRNSFVSFMTSTSTEIFNRVRAFNPDPIARTYVNFLNYKREFLLFEVDFADFYKLNPGQVMFIKKRGLFVGTLLGSLFVKKAGFPNKKILENQQMLSLKGKITKFY